jgi:hypothetical protein
MLYKLCFHRLSSDKVLKEKKKYLLALAFEKLSTF